ncbi:MAG: hypothetical protein ACREPG_05155 [Candidatus Binatia bacterium]
MGGGNAQAAASLRLPLIPISLYLNIEAALAENDPTARLESLRIGQLPVPAWLAYWAAPRLLSLLVPDFDYQAFVDAVKKVSMTEARLSVTYQWQADLVDKLRTVLIPRKEQEQLRIYQERLAEITQASKASDLPLTELLTAMFKLAAERSRGSDPVAENRAALLVLMHYVTGKNLHEIVLDAKSWTLPAKHRIVLDAPEEFPRRFISNAALAANAGGPLTQAVGVYKEIADARADHGMAFKSFAVDRAGRKFGEYAGNGTSAKKLQEKLDRGLSEKESLPTTADLPPFLSANEFKRRFGGIDGAEYKKMMAEIERRIAALPFYR